MGWSSATGIFDAAVDVTLNFLGMDKSKPNYGAPVALVFAVVEHMYRDLPLEDWDTQNESKYFYYILPVMYMLGEIDKDEHDRQLGELSG